MFRRTEMWWWRGTTHSTGALKTRGLESHTERNATIYFVTKLGLQVQSPHEKLGVAWQCPSVDEGETGRRSPRAYHARSKSEKGHLLSCNSNQGSTLLEHAPIPHHCEYSPQAQQTTCTPRKNLIKWLVVWDLFLINILTLMLDT